MYITVEIDDVHLKTMLAQRQPGIKKTEYEVDLDPTWTINKLQMKVRDDIM